MGLFSRRKDPRRETASAIAKRGVRVRGTIDAVAEEPDGVLAVTVRFAPQGESSERVVTARQPVAPQARVGLEPGEPVDLSYDRDDPTVVVIWGSPKYRVGETGAVVRVVDLEGGETG